MIRVIDTLVSSEASEAFSAARLALPVASEALLAVPAAYKALPASFEALNAAFEALLQERHTEEPHSKAAAYTIFIWSAMSNSAIQTT